MGIGKKIGKVHKKTSKYSKSKADYLSATDYSKNTGYRKYNSSVGDDISKLLYNKKNEGSSVQVNIGNASKDAIAVQEFIKNLEAEDKDFVNKDNASKGISNFLLNKT